MSSLGLLQNGTFSQNSYAYLIVGLIETIMKFTKAFFFFVIGSFFPLVLFFSRMHRLKFVENICAMSQALMGIQRNVSNSTDFCLQPDALFLTDLKYELLR